MAILFSLQDAPVTDLEIGFEIYEDITSVIGVDNNCGGSFATVTPLGGGAELVAGCTFGDSYVTGDFGSIDFIVGARYAVDIVGDAPVVITLYDSGGTLPDFFTYLSGGTAQYPSWAPENHDDGSNCGYDAAPGTVCTFDFMAVGIGSGVFESVTIRETVLPEPASITIVAAALLALAALRLRKPWQAFASRGSFPGCAYSSRDAASRA
jgi:hypothetical protein